MQANLKSFVDIDKDSHFSIYNLPYGVFKTQEESTARIGTAIGNYVLDLAQLEAAGLFGANKHIFQQDSLNAFASLGSKSQDEIRTRLQSLLRHDNPELQNNKTLLNKALIPQTQVTMQLPFKITGFSDFYASEQHATNVGKLFRGKENPLLPNWKFLPVGYNGRASTVFLSGTEIARPKGQIKPPDQERPKFSPSRKLDFELEMGIFVGAGNADGKPISVDQANNHIFGLTLLNDWSARDIQAFEYQPLGPFLSKSFATSISPWVVPLAALIPFKVPHQPQVPETVDYLKQNALQQLDIKLKVELKTQQSKTRTTICETNFRELYWTIEQILAHHTINNCIMRSGDLLGSGTISGPQRENWGSLLEITFNGSQPIKLSTGEERGFLEDGDTIIMSAYCETPDYKVGFGSLEGTIIATRD